MWPLKWNLSSHFGLLRGSFWPFSDSKIKLSGFLKVVLGVFEKLFRNYFYLNNALLWGYFQLKRLIFVLKKKIVKLVNLTIFRLKKVVLLTFWKMFGWCSEVIWALLLALKDQFLSVIQWFQPQEWRNELKIKSVGQILAVWEGHFGRFQFQKSRFLDIFEVAFELIRIRIWMVLSPEGRYVVYPVGVQLSSLSIYWILG